MASFRSVLRVCLFMCVFRTSGCLSEDQKRLSALIQRFYSPSRTSYQLQTEAWVVSSSSETSDQPKTGPYRVTSSTLTSDQALTQLKIGDFSDLSSILNSDQPKKGPVSATPSKLSSDQALKEQKPEPFKFFSSFLNSNQRKTGPFSAVLSTLTSDQALTKLELGVSGDLSSILISDQPKHAPKSATSSPLTSTQPSRPLKTGHSGVYSSILNSHQQKTQPEGATPSILTSDQALKRQKLKHASVFSSILNSDQPKIRPKSTTFPNLTSDQALKQLKTKPFNASSSLLTPDQLKPGPRVLIKTGFIEGLTLDKFHVFLGIPFADPPMGSFRWRPPRPVTPWRGVYDASYPRAECLQACVGPLADECPTKVSEDCLYLNIFVPLSVDLSVPLRRPLPVMLWIHGGDFIAGSAVKPLYDGRFISNFTETLLVSIAYRLGALGYLVTGAEPHTAATGNYGILDQQAALLWVQQNIAAFGGDPSRVTIFGESAGAQSVALHLIIQSSKPLFKQAILQSLPFSIPLKTRHESLKLGTHFVKAANCSLLDVQCLLSLSPEDVLNAQIQSSSKLVNPFRFLEQFESWGPVIDGELLKEQVLSAFQRGHWQKDKPLLLGTTSEEGVLFVYGVFSKPVSAVESTVYTTAIFKQHAIKVLRRYLPLYSQSDHRDMLAQIVTDYVFLCPSRRAARAGVSIGSLVWMYIFDHVTSDPRVWSGLSFCFRHVCHGAELPFVFDSAEISNFTLTRPERLLSNRMLCHWGAFAHNGDPGSHKNMSRFCRQQRPPVWPWYAMDTNWMVMNFTLTPHVQTGPRNEICDFWDKLGIYP